ncbi:MAG: hypothetical protein OEN50_19230 [Deltaproteobacteria bacterium]|nr:hypothetical protein [Deltaproteobacteria bacterium]
MNALQVLKDLFDAGELFDAASDLEGPVTALTASMSIRKTPLVAVPSWWPRRTSLNALLLSVPATGDLVHRRLVKIHFGAGESCCDLWKNRLNAGPTGHLALCRGGGSAGDCHRVALAFRDPPEE